MIGVNGVAQVIAHAEDVAGLQAKGSFQSANAHDAGAARAGVVCWHLRFPSFALSGEMQ